jgi:hypothetical protein
VKNEVLHGIKEEKKVLNTTRRRKVNWIRHILPRYSVLRNNFEGKRGNDRNDGEKRKKM